jgi:hypothetical protein
LAEQVVNDSCEFAGAVTVGVESLGMGLKERYRSCGTRRTGVSVAVRSMFGRGVAMANVCRRIAYELSNLSKVNQFVESRGGVQWSRCIRVNAKMQTAT